MEAKEIKAVLALLPNYHLIRVTKTQNFKIQVKSLHHDKSIYLSLYKRDFQNIHEIAAEYLIEYGFNICAMSYYGNNDIFLMSDCFAELPKPGIKVTKVEEQLNNKFHAKYITEQSMMEQFGYLLNSEERFDTCNKEHLIKCWKLGKLGTLLKRLDPLSFSILTEPSKHN